MPASSPFQPSRPKPLGSRLAPAGTIFRPPTRPPVTMATKRPAPEPISLLSDDEEDLTPPRGDIRPTAFGAHVSSFAYKPEQLDDRQKERMEKQKLRQIFDVFGSKFSAERVKEALRRHDYDLDDSIDWLERNFVHKPVERPPKLQPNGLINRQFAPRSSMSGSSGSQGQKHPAHSATAPSPPRKAKRRLVQGLRKRVSSSSPQKFDQEVVAIPSSDDPLVIDLADNDVEDAYEAEKSPSPELDNDRVLTCINTSTLKDLAAITGMNESDLAVFVDKRPFADLAQARKVSIDKKPGARKSARISIGESAVESIEVFLTAVSAIDDVVAKCEEKAQIVKGVMDTWDLDTFGRSKISSRGTPEKDFPLTPTSLTGSRFTRPLVPTQPKLMDGHCELKPFQLFGLNWMSVLYNYDIGCILADEMGLGKTCQVISLICHLVEEYRRQPKGQRPWPNLIVVPPSTYENWLSEFERFAPDLSVLGYRGSQSERAEIAEEVHYNPEAYHVVLGTYSQINSEADIESLQSFDINAAIFDEGHKMKNPETKLYKFLRRITASWKMLLTGMWLLDLGTEKVLTLPRHASSKQSPRDDFASQFHQSETVRWLHGRYSVHIQPEGHDSRRKQRGVPVQRAGQACSHNS